MFRLEAKQFCLPWKYIQSPKMYMPSTVNPLYNNTQKQNQNNKIHYTDNLTDTKPSLERWYLVRNYARIDFNTSRKSFGYLLESPRRGDSSKYPKRMPCDEIRIKQGFIT